jgi:D-alanyl-D-alanine carboxypeptidase
MTGAHSLPSTIAISLMLAACSAPPVDAGSPSRGRGHGATGGEGGAGATTASGGAQSGGASSTGGSGGVPTPSFPCTADQSAFDGFAAEVGADLKAHGVVGGALAVVCGGSTLYTAGLGQTATGGSAVDAHTRFQLASTTKTLTAALAVRLAERGILSLDDPVSKWVPNVNTSAPYSQGFTLAQLLSHTSGYPAGIDTALYQDLNASFQANANVALWSPPGEVFNYSNDGFALAGLVLQTAAGQPFGTLLENEVMKPAGMGDARMNAATVQSEGNYAVGYSSWDGMAYQPTDGYLAMPYYGPMGGAWASAEDLGHFAQALISGGGDLFGAEALAEMTDAQTPTTWGARQYGLGLFVDDLSGTMVWGHDGSVGGFLSSLSIVPSRGLAVVMLVNSDDYLPDPSYQLDDAAQLFTGSGLPYGEAGGFDPASEPEHVGSYQSNALGSIQVQKNGAQMQIVIGGQGATMTPTWRDSYWFDYQSMEMDANFWRMGDAVKYVVTPYGVGARTN